MVGPARRATQESGELNPQAWPPIVDGDSFEVSPAGAEQGDPGAAPAEPVPEGLTIDDLD